MFINWNDEKHSIQIPEIDTHHKQLFTLTNQLMLLKEKKDLAQVLIVLKRLYAYTKYHFSAEEALFRNFGYIESKPHKKLHDTFTDKIKDWIEEVRSDPRVSLDTMVDFLVEWILDHIQRIATKYAWWFQQQGINPQLFFNPAMGKHQKSDVETDALAIWQEQQMSLNLKDIDNQHRELISILQQANDLLLAVPERRKLFTPVIIKKLYYYVQFHFSFEEELMAQSGYKDFKRHRTLHGEFTQKIREFADDYNNRVSTVNEKIVRYLKNWTIEHILIEDRKYKDTVLSE